MGIQDQDYGQEGVDKARYDKICDIFGGHGEYVSEPGEIVPAMTRAFRAAEEGIPAIVNVHMDPRVHNRQLVTANYSVTWSHIPWSKLAPRARAVRRFYFGAALPFDKYGIPEMRLPDPWEPAEDNEDLTITKD